MVVVFVAVTVFVVVTVLVVVCVTVVVQELVVVAVPMIFSVIVAVEPWYAFPSAAMSVTVIVDVKDAAGPKLEGIGPFEALKPFLDCVTVTPREERLAGRFPVFSTAYVMTALSPGAKGPTEAVADAEGMGEVTANLT